MENKHRLVSIFCFIIWGYFSIQWSSTRTSTSVTNADEVFFPNGIDSVIKPVEKKSYTPLVSCIYTTAANELGVTESGGNNKGKRVGEYLKVTGLPEGYAWCAAYVSWVLKQCDVKVKYSARAHDMATYNIIYKKLNGDKFPTNTDSSIYVFGIHTYSQKTYNHTGFIPDIRKAAVYTNEGNTNSKGSSDGDKVEIIIRPIATIDVISNYIK